MFEDRIAALNQANTEKMAIESTQYDKRTYTVDEIQDILGISRTSAYNLVKKNYFRFVRIGGTIRISKKSFDEWLDQQIQVCQGCQFSQRQTSGNVICSIYFS